MNNNAAVPIRLQTVFPVTSTETEQFRGKTQQIGATNALAFSFSLHGHVEEADASVSAIKHSRYRSFLVSHFWRLLICEWAWKCVWIWSNIWHKSQLLHVKIRQLPVPFYLIISLRKLLRRISKWSVSLQTLAFQSNQWKATLHDRKKKTMRQRIPWSSRNPRQDPACKI